MKNAAIGAFIATLTLMVVAGIVRAQIVFPDGTQQSTAFGPTSFSTGTAFAEVVPFAPDDILIAISPEAVPQGKELVVLQVFFPNVSAIIPPSFTLESRLASPNEAAEPINLVYCPTPMVLHAGRIFPETIEFPNGTVIVDEGRQLWLQFRESDFVPKPARKTSALSVLGYFRDKT